MLLEKYVSRLCHCECRWQTNNAWGRQEWGKRTCCNEWSETFFTYQSNCRRARENTTRNNVSCIHIAAITLTLKSIPNERKQITTDFYLDSMTAQHRLCHNKKQHRRENARMCWTQRVRKRTKNPNGDHLPYQCTVQSTLEVCVLRKTVSIFHYELGKAIASFIYCLVKSPIPSHICHCSFSTTLCQLAQKKGFESWSRRDEKVSGIRAFQAENSWICFWCRGFYTLNGRFHLFFWWLSMSILSFALLFEIGSDRMERLIHRIPLFTWESFQWKSFRPFTCRLAHLIKKKKIGSQTIHPF